MTQRLDVIFRELGIAQYLDTFVEQGFDTWDTILDIQESDLDALGVKLGHRRKLQRRIANARGIAPSEALATPLRPDAEEARPDSARKETVPGGNTAEIPVVTKRKYRRHPKADENAPERSPSAYVLFSNKLRERLRGQTLTFTEIAKLVGDNWQSLSAFEREKYESRAAAAKEKYHRDMSQYKKTAEYRKYTKYLQEFKEKQGKPSQGQETAKRPRIEPNQLVQGSAITGSSTASSSAAIGGAMSIASGSSNQRIRESESREPPPSHRHDSVKSVASATDSRHSSTVPRSTESVPSPRSPHFDIGTSKRGQQRHSRRAPSLRGRGRRGDTAQQSLPSLSDMLVGQKELGGGPALVESHGFVAGFFQANHHRQPALRGSTVLPLVPIPFLCHESSSSGSSAPGSAAGFGRTPSEGPLAIHSLLSDPNTSTHHGYERSPSSATSVASPAEQGKPLFGHFQGARSYGFTSPFAFQPIKVEESGDSDVLMTSADEPSVSRQGSNGKGGFDGMNALLRAGEIVGRHDRDG